MTARRILIAPSLLSADFIHLCDAIDAIEGSADYIHCDIMDGHFVPNLTFGPPIIAAIKKYAKIPLDVHLMIEAPHLWIERYCTAGLDGNDFLTIHLEAEVDPLTVLEHIRRMGVRPGLSLKPGTPITAAEQLFSAIDQLLVMTVEPGFGGQRFMKDQLDKVSSARKLGRQGLVIGVDGGIDVGTAKLAVEAGADLLVAGSTIFSNKHEPDPARAIQMLRDAVQ